MTPTTLLQQVLETHFNWHGARLNFLAHFLVALYRVKTVNLVELASAFGGQASSESHYKRLQRFFRSFELDYTAFAQVVVNLIGLKERWVLTLDRTQWQFGKQTFNILMLGVAHQGIAFPLLWTLLPKQGNSKTQQRTDLIQRLWNIFPVSRIAYLTADREFLGKQWFIYLLKQPLSFRIRIRHSDTLSNGRDKAIAARVLFQDLQPNQIKVLPKRRRLWGRWLYVAGMRLEDRSLLVVVTPDSPRTAITDYAKRWQIETLFGCLKSRGFCLESTHLSDPKRLSKLLALLTLALCWAFRTGEWLHQLKPLKIKKHGRKHKSIFRYGFDHLRRIVLNLEPQFAQFRHALQFLSCT